MLDRLTHWPTTIAGTTAGVVVIIVLTSFGCHLPSDWVVWLAGIVPAVMGALSK